MGALAIHLSRRGPPDADAVRRMLASAPHRGSRRQTEALGDVCVGVCNGPDRVTATVASDSGRLAVFHGTLDNDASLRSELRGEDAPLPEAATPAATLLAAVDRWGEEAVARFRGSFAGAVTDGRVLHCFRDQFGTRPLFHHDAAEGFFAATEAKQVLEGAGIAREPNREHLRAVLFGRGVGRSTAYRGVERLPTRAVCTVGPDTGLEVRRYWEPAEHVETADLGPAEAVEGTREALDRAVRRSLAGRDAILLSGGLDSPALAAFAAPNSKGDGDGRLRAVTAVYPEHPSADEREWTELAADHLGIPLEAYVAEAGSLDDVDFWVRALDGPVSVLSIPESAESYRAARSLGARTVLTGEMAEMLFGSRAYLLGHLLTHGRLRAAGRLLARLRASGSGPIQLVRRVGRALAPPALLAALRGDARSRRREHPAWVGEYDEGESSSVRPLWATGPRRRWLRAQTSPFRGSGSGFEADEICAAHSGVDVRRPFADVDLWEFVLSLPAEVKFPGGRTKPLLRRAMRGLLPDELIDRTDKTYFDEFHLATADYPALRRLVIESPHRLDGVDYQLLERRVAGEAMGVYELQWARNLARIHAFLEQW